MRWLGLDDPASAQNPRALLFVEDACLARRDRIFTRRKFDFGGSLLGRDNNTGGHRLPSRAYLDHARGRQGCENIDAIELYALRTQRLSWPDYNAPLA